MDTEDKIVQALQQIQADDPGDPRPEGLGQMLGDMFGQQAAWLSVVSSVVMLALSALAVVSTVRFFHVEVPKDALFYCTLFLFNMMSVAFVKFWYWLRNSTIREIKLFELRLRRRRTEDGGFGFSIRTERSRVARLPFAGARMPSPIVVEG